MYLHWIKERKFIIEFLMIIFKKKKKKEQYISVSIFKYVICTTIRWNKEICILNEL